MSTSSVEAPSSADVTAAGPRRGSMVSPARAWLRGEGLAVLLLSVLLYANLGRGWLLFAALLLAPDLSMIGYAAGPRVGAWAYNLVHSYAAPLLLAGAALLSGSGVHLALIWCAHIGMDRALGYGLKLPTGFQDTHLGRIGRRG
ncbi:MAG TPA: DUF4260 domain-containing protein [Longimicrobiaceae bacterium]|nr:DUF4260 domain-containing protein [Longimicrobiaceae bacterium]